MTRDIAKRPLPRADYRLVQKMLAGFPDFQAAGHVLVAVSGGADSTALLELLALAGGDTDGASRKLTVAYVDHGLRAETPMESAVVRASAARHGLDFVPLAIARAKNPSESLLRERRYQVLERLADEIGADWLATGHTYDDQIETVLFRFLRGSGRRGLSGILSCRARIVRPLLGIRRERLRVFLRRRGIAWIEDPSNADVSYARNRLRHVVMPAIERELGAGALDHLPLLAERWRAEEDYLDEQSRRFTAYAVQEAAAGAPIVDLRALDQAAAPIRTRVLRAWLARMSGQRAVSLAQLAALEALIASRAGSATARIAGVAVVREYDTLRVASAASCGDSFVMPVDVARKATLLGPSGCWRLMIEPSPERSAQVRCGPCGEELDLDPAALDGPLRLRSLRAGDTIRTVGGSASNVRDIMVELRLPRRVRDDWPVLAHQEDVIWVPGIARADTMAIAQDAQRPVRLAWRRVPL